MADINALQAAASRYAIVAGFNSVVPTGVMDDQTLKAVTGALIWIRDHAPGENDNASGILAKLTGQAALTSSADGITTYLSGVADVNGVGGSNLDFAPQAPGITSFKQLWDQIPMWAKVAGGAGLIVGLVFLGHGLAKRSAQALHGSFGFSGSFQAPEMTEDDVEIETDYIDAEYTEA